MPARLSTSRYTKMCCTISERCHYLQVDVEETRNSYRWYADVPGLTKDNIQVGWPASCSFQS